MKILWNCNFFLSKHENLMILLILGENYINITLWRPVSLAVIMYMYAVQSPAIKAVLCIEIN